MSNVYKSDKEQIIDEFKSGVSIQNIISNLAYGRKALNKHYSKVDAQKEVELILIEYWNTLRY